MGNYIGEQSTFNEGAGQMDRINKLQEEINRLWCSPFELEYFTRRRYYQIIFSNLNSLLLEVSSKLTQDELDLSKSEREKIQPLMFISIDEYKRWESISKPNKTKIVPNNKNRDIIINKLFEYGLFIRKLLEEHNMTSPKLQDPSKAIFRN